MCVCVRLVVNRSIEDRFSGGVADIGAGPIETDL